MAMSKDEADSAAELLGVTVNANPYIPVTPFAKQAEFLALPHEEAFYGGAAGPGKSEALLMAALQYVPVPGYAALLLRRTLSELQQPSALIDRSHQWLRGSGAQWNGSHYQWTFPGRSTLTFGYCANDRDLERYQSAEFQFIGIDEVGELTAFQYTYLFSRLRRKDGVEIPTRMRSASNPGSEWVKRRFVSPGSPDRPFVPAVIADNPYIDQADYVKHLQHLDPVTRAQLLNGDWDVRRDGGLFRRAWFGIVGEYPANAKLCRFWDLAATAVVNGNDPDYTVGVLLAAKAGRYWVVDVRRIRGTPAEVERLVLATAERDGQAVRIVIEEEPGSSGKNTIDHYRRYVLKGYNVSGERATGSKTVRAGPVSSAAEAGNITLLNRPWADALLDELSMFPSDAAHDDQVDALCGAHRNLTTGANTPSSMEVW